MGGGCTVLRSIDAQRSEMVDLYPLTGGDDDDDDDEETARGSPRQVGGRLLLSETRLQAFFWRATSVGNGRQRINGNRGRR